MVVTSSPAPTARRGRGEGRRARGSAPSTASGSSSASTASTRRRSRELGGTGLGLAIVKHLAESIGATVSVESEPGQGRDVHGAAASRRWRRPRPRVRPEPRLRARSASAAPSGSPDRRLALVRRPGSGRARRSRRARRAAARGNTRATAPSAAPRRPEPAQDVDHRRAARQQPALARLHDEAVRERRAHGLRCGAPERVAVERREAERAAVRVARQHEAHGPVAERARAVVEEPLGRDERPVVRPLARHSASLQNCSTAARPASEPRARAGRMGRHEPEPTRNPLLSSAAILLLGPFGSRSGAASAAEAVDLLLSGGTVVTMDAGFRVLEDAAVAVRGERIVAVGAARELAAPLQRREDDRHHGPDRDAGPREHPHPRAHDAAARRGRRRGADGLAHEVHLAGRERPRHPGVRHLGHAARGLGDDPHRHHHLRRHVLLRGPGGGGHEGSGAARLLRGHRDGPPGARAQERRRGPARGRGLLEEVVGRPADRARGRAARRLHGRARDPAARQGPGRPLPGAHHDPRRREPERDGDDPGEVRHARPSPTSTGSASWGRTSRSRTRSG